MKIYAGLLAVSVVLTLSSAAAQMPNVRQEPPPDEISPGQTVLDRPRPEYDALGVPVGGFLLFPALSIRQEFNSNVFATQRGTISDLITVLEPSFALRSNWSNHALEFFASAAIGRYWDETSENYEDFTVGTTGRLDVTRQTQIFAGASFKELHEDRGSPDDVGGKEPTEYSLTTASLGVRQGFNRLSFRLDGIFDRYDFRDVSAGGGGTIDRDGRDRNQYLVRLRSSYEFAPLREVYLLTSANWRDYRKSRDASGFDRDSTGFEIAAGIQYDLSGVTFIDFFIGYRQQDYADGSLKTARGPSGGLKLTWNVTRLTTVTGSLSREIEETTLAGSSSYFATRGDLTIDHELRRNLILSASLGYEHDSYEGISRDDNYYRAGVAARYLIDRNFVLEGAYSFRTRDSNAPNSDFDENVFYVRVTGRL